MDDELLRKIERLEAQVEALTSERIPKVDRASKRRDKRQVFAGFGLFAVAILIAGTMSASALSGSNTVLSDDIKDTEVHGSDINTNAVTGAKVKDNSLTGADINESTLSPKTFFARVSSTGTLSGGHATSVSHNAPGSYNVTFPFKTTACAAVATIGGFENSGTVDYGANVTTEVNPPTVGAPYDKQVRVYTGKTSTFDTGFVLVLTCP